MVEPEAFWVDTSGLSVWRCCLQFVSGGEWSPGVLPPWWWEG